MRIRRYLLLIALEVGLITALAGAQTPAAQSQAPSANQPALEALADKLIAAPSEQARSALLDANKDLLMADLSTLLRKKADDLQDAGKPSLDSLNIYHIALALAERLNDPRQIAMSHNGISLLLYGEEDYEHALESEHKAIFIFEALQDPELAVAYIHLGNILTVQGNYREAADYYDRALKLSEAHNDKANVARSLYNLGNCYQYLGNPRLALEQYKKSMEVSQALGLEVGLAHNTEAIGELYHAQGDYDLALAYYQQSLHFKEKIKNRKEIANALSDISMLYRDIGKDALALDYARKALKLDEAADDKEGGAESLRIYGELLQKHGKYSEALERYQTGLAWAEATGSKYTIAQILLGMSELCSVRKDYLHSLEYAQRAAEIERQMGVKRNLPDAMDDTAMALTALGRTEEARATLTQAIGAVEEVRGDIPGAEEEQAHFLAGSISPYRLMVQLLFSQNKPEEAFAFAEQAKARVLLDVLRSGRVSVEKAMTAEERDQEHRLVGRITSLNAQLASETSKSKVDAARLSQLNADLKQARFDYRNFQTTLYAAHPELQIQRGQAQPVAVGETAPLLPDAKTALFEFTVNEDKTYLFVLSKELHTGSPHLTTYTVPIREKDLAARVESFRQQLATRNPDYGKSARSLFRLLLGPAHAILAGKRTVVIVPDGALWDLPFQALQVSDGHHLLEDAAIFYAPSLTVLAEMTKRRSEGANEPPRLLALGNPMLKDPALVASLIKQREHTLGDHVQRSRLEDLPSAEHEVAVLAQLYGAQHSSVYIRSAASEQVFKNEAPKYDVLHLASHGVFDNTSPMYSHLVLSDGGTGDDDGLLEAWEFINLNLKARLVVLSACETARGKVSGGEGLIGMSWAFFVAGSPSLVASQWKVDSASTTELMLRFHRGLQGVHSTPKARALQQAALQVMKKPAYHHPYYWAGFVLIGDAR